MQLRGFFVRTFLCQQGLRESVQDESKREALIAKYLDRFAMETTAVFASSRLLDDGVILPQDTRRVCCLFQSVSPKYFLNNNN